MLNRAAHSQNSENTNNDKNNYKESKNSKHDLPHFTSKHNKTPKGKLHSLDLPVDYG